LFHLKNILIAKPRYDQQKAGKKYQLESNPKWVSE
jgi:hypothetical protein